MILFCRVLIATCLLGTAVSTLDVFPRQLAYFNEAAGGPENGWRHLLGSNLDWGQGLVELSDLMREQQDWGPIAICYEGMFDQGLIGTRAITVNDGNLGRSLSKFSHIAISASKLWRRRQVDGSHSLINGIEDRICDHFKHRLPVHRVDESILVFRVDGFADVSEASLLNGSKERDVGWKTVHSALQLPTLADAVGIDRPGVSGLLHILLLHGLGETGFQNPATGAEALRILTDEQLGRLYFGESPLIRTTHGIRYRTHLIDAMQGEADNAETHRDQCLATFAVLGIPLNEPIHIGHERYSFQDLLKESIANFTLEQRELTWTATAYAHYVAPHRSWANRFGNVVTFSELLEHLMGLPLESQSCAGFHVVQAIIEIVNTDYNCDILTPGVRRDSHNYIARIRSALYRNQNVDGSWDYDWNRMTETPQVLSPTVYQKLVATGHAIETLHHMQPAPVARPLVRGTKWLLEALPPMDLRASQIAVCPATHGLRALNLSYANRTLSVEMMKLFSCNEKKE